MAGGAPDLPRSSCSTGRTDAVGGASAAPSRRAPRRRPGAANVCATANVAAGPGTPPTPSPLSHSRAGSTRGSSALVSRGVDPMRPRLAPADAARNHAHPRGGIGLSTAPAWGKSGPHVRISRFLPLERRPIASRSGKQTSSQASPMPSSSESQWTREPSRILPVAASPARRARPQARCRWLLGEDDLKRCVRPTTSPGVWARCVSTSRAAPSTRTPLPTAPRADGADADSDEALRRGAPRLRASRPGSMPQYRQV